MDTSGQETMMNKEFRYKCNAGVYETDSYFALGWMIFSHRCWHLWNHGKWMD